MYETDVNSFSWKNLIDNIRKALVGHLFVTSYSASATVPDSVFFCVVDTTSGNVTMTLPLAANNKDKQYCFKKLVAANTMTIAANSADTIEGSATATATAHYATIYVVSDGQNTWYRIA
jgi:hypothetical protein